MAVDSAAIKRAIIEEAGKRSGIREKMEANAPQLTDGQRIEMGNELEHMTKTKGWVYVEAYIINNINPAVTLFMKPEDTAEARGMLKIMQYIAVAIQNRDRLIEEDRKKRENKE